MIGQWRECPVCNRNRSSRKLRGYSGVRVLRQHRGLIGGVCDGSNFIIFADDSVVSPVEEGKQP